MSTASVELPPPEDTRSEAYRLAADLQSLASAAKRTQLGEWDGNGVPGWVGEAEDAYTSSIRYLDGKLDNLVSALNQAVPQAWGWGDAVSQTIDIELPKLHNAWDEVEIWEKMEKQRVSDALEAEEVDPAFAMIRNLSIEAEALEQRNDLRAKYKQLMEQLDATAAELAGKLVEARGEVLPPESGNSRDEIGQNLFKDGSILEAQTKWERAEEKAREIANELESWAGSEDDYSGKKVVDFLAKYGDDLEDPFVATALGALIPPEEMLNLCLDAGRIKEADVTKQLASKVGTVMVLASGGVNLSQQEGADQELYLRFQDALPETRVNGVSLHDSYAQQLLHAGRAEYKRPWIHWPNSKGFDLIAQMMGQAALTNPHLALGGELMRAEDEEGSFMEGLLLHDHEVLTVQRNNETRWPWTGVRRYSLGLDERLKDPIFAMAALMDNPEGSTEFAAKELQIEGRDRVNAIRDFLGSDIEGVESKAVNVTEYIMGGRAVNESRVLQSGGWAPYSGFPDGGALFSAVAAEAAFPESEEGYDRLSEPEQMAWKRRDKAGTAIVEGYIRGYQHGLDTYRPGGLEDVDGQRPYGYENQAMRSAAAEVIGPRLKGVSMSIDSTTGVHPGEQDGEKARYLVALDEDTAKKVRGPNGVLVDLAFDNADQQSGQPTDRRATATEKLLFWASKGYADDLRESIREKRSAEDPTTALPGISAEWAPIVETLFEGPQGASAQVEGIIKKRNETWKPVLGAAGSVGAAAGGVAGPAWGFASGAALSLYLPLLDALLPTDQDTTPDQEYRATTQFMMGTLAAVAAEELDFTKVPKLPSVHLERNDHGSEVVGPGESILPVGSMTSQELRAFQNYLTDGLSEWNFDEARSEIQRKADDVYDQDR